MQNERTLKPQHELLRPPLAGEADPDAPRFGWSALMNIRCSDLTGSRRVGYESIPPRTLVKFETITVDQPPEDEKKFRDLGTNFTSEPEWVRKSAQSCCYDIFQNYSPLGFTRFLALVGREDAEDIFNAIYPMDFQTFADADAYVQSDEPEKAIRDTLAVTQQAAAKQTLNEMRAACVIASNFANETLDQSETEMQARANGAKEGKKRYDDLDLFLFEATGRVPPQFKQIDSTERLIGAIGSKDDTLKDAMIMLAQNQAETQKQLAAQAETQNKILSMLAEKKGKS